MLISDVAADDGAWSQPIPAPRRRASAQKRLRAEAQKLDMFTDLLPWPAVKDAEDEVTLSASQLRLVANLLDHPSWGQE